VTGGVARLAGVMRSLVGRWWAFYAVLVGGEDLAGWVGCGGGDGVGG